MLALLTATLDALVADYGLFGLAVVAFLAATLLPFSSEVAVVGALEVGFSPIGVLLAASIGNALGASFNYGLGWWPSERLRTKLDDSRSGKRALAWAERHGKWSLLGSWLPIVGDPLCIVAGLIRVPLWFFVLIGIGTRVARYVVLIVAFS
ncbi:MAG: YqaA family protein [Rhodothermales bacterium]